MMEKHLPDKKWYIVHAYSNFERKVADSIREKAQATGLGELFDEILLPTEKVVEVRRGRKVDAERKRLRGWRVGFDRSLRCRACPTSGEKEPFCSRKMAANSNTGRSTRSDRQTAVGGEAPAKRPNRDHGIPGRPPCRPA